MKLVNKAQREINEEYFFENMPIPLHYPKIWRWMEPKPEPSEDEILINLQARYDTKHKLCLIGYSQFC